MKYDKIENYEPLYFQDSIIDYIKSDKDLKLVEIKESRKVTYAMIYNKGTGVIHSMGISGDPVRLERFLKINKLKAIINHAKKRS